MFLTLYIFVSQVVIRRHFMKKKHLVFFLLYISNNEFF